MRTGVVASLALAAAFASASASGAPAAGGYLVSDAGNDRIGYVTTAGVVETVAGTGSAGFNGDGLSATAAGLLGEGGSVVDVDLDDTSPSDEESRERPDDDDGKEQREDKTKRDEKEKEGDEKAQEGDEKEKEGDEKAPPPPAAPVAGRHVNVAPVRGTVTVKKPGGRYVGLTHAATVPVGSVVDARRGAVRLVSAADLKGRRQAAVFHGAVFAVRQKRSRRPVTELVLRGGSFGSCTRSARRSSGPLASSSARRARRGLWGRGRGRFRTRGRNGSATVRGTIWLTQDRCDGTLVRVRRGLVAVRDFTRARTVVVKTGRSYLAPARRPAGRR